MKSSEKIENIIKSGQLSKMIGLEEDAHFEAKGRNAYNLETAKGRYELAKDVSAFANAESGTDSIMHLLQNPGKLRPSGWDLVTYDIPQIVKGEFLEVKNYTKNIRVYEDGTLILRSLSDHNYLSWGQYEEDFKKFPRLNPIALIELTYNFIDFYKKLSRHFDSAPQKIKLRCELKNAFLKENAKLCLTPHEVGKPAWSSEYFKAEAPENDMIKEIEKELDFLLNYPAHVAYELIEKLYLWFGHTSSDIPYTNEDEQRKKFIDINQIKKVQ